MLDGYLLSWHLLSTVSKDTADPLCYLDDSPISPCGMKTKFTFTSKGFLAGISQDLKEILALPVLS
jgi:hypothetical protein